MMKYLLPLLGFTFIAHSSLATRQVDQSEKDAFFAGLDAELDADIVAIQEANEGFPSYFSASQWNDLRADRGIFRSEDKKFIACFLREDGSTIYPFGDDTPFQRFPQNAEARKMRGSFWLRAYPNRLVQSISDITLRTGHTISSVQQERNVERSLDSRQTMAHITCYRLFNENNVIGYFALLLLESQENGTQVNLEEKDMRALFANGLNAQISHFLGGCQFLA